MYVSFSGGKDSTVLLDLVRQEFPEVVGVFIDTGLEYPEIIEFVKKTKNVTWIKPKQDFLSTIKKYGYPIISKEQSQYLYEYRTAKSEKTKHTRWYGNKNKRGKISEKYKPLIQTDFKISGKCCEVMKKRPIKRYEKETGQVPLIGTMASESQLRQKVWEKYGCNSFKSKSPASKPISFWLEKDVWEYIKRYQLPYSKIYDMGYNRTGCMFCAFGIHLVKGKNKFQLMEETHPQIHKYCLENLGLKEIVEFMNENCKCNINLKNARTSQLQLPNG